MFLGINAYFTPAGSYDGASKYTKRTLYRGQETEFSLFRCQLTDDTRRRCVSIVPMNAHPGTPTDIDFYISPRGGDGSLPPRHDWLRISESEGTATEVHLIGGSTNIQVFVDTTTTMLPSAIEWIGRDKFGFSLMYDVIRAIPTLLEFHMSRGRKKCGEGEGEGGRRILRRRPRRRDGGGA